MTTTVDSATKRPAVSSTPSRRSATHMCEFKARNRLQINGDTAPQTLLLDWLPPGMFHVIIFIRFFFEILVFMFFIDLLIEL